MLEHVEGYHELSAKTKIFFSIAIAKWDTEIYVKVDDDVHINLDLSLAVEMASTARTTGWLRGKVKAVPSGDSLVIMGSTKAEIPPEKTITLSSLIAPRLARRGGIDESFAWESREYLRKLCIGKDVTFRVDYTVPAIGREFGSVFLGDKNVSLMVVAGGWAKVREQGQQKGEASPFLAELLHLEEQAKQQGLGRWSRAPGAYEAAIRNLPPSAVGDSGNLDAMGLLASNKGRPMEAIVEQVRDGSTLRMSNEEHLSAMHTIAHTYH
ncbi:unnamed protein product [Camellia sinensis]